MTFFFFTLSLFGMCENQTMKMDKFSLCFKIKQKKKIG
jgi:hypothetical protein